MLKFDKENKITFEQLSYSLQEKIRKAVTRTEMDQVIETIELYEKCLNSVRFSIVDSLSKIGNPISEKEVAILNDNGVFYLYIYSGNRWIKVPTYDVYYHLVIEQSEHQKITVTANGKKYTTSVNLKYGTRWTAEIESDSLYYKAGTLNASEGALTGHTIIKATPATVVYNFELNATIAKHASKNYYGFRLNYKGAPPSEDFYGKCSPNILDTLNIRKLSSRYESSINFWDTDPLLSDYHTVTITMEYNGTAYSIIQNVSASLFNNTGDLKNYEYFTTEYYYNLFKSLKGKKVKLYIHFG